MLFSCETIATQFARFADLKQQVEVLDSFQNTHS